MLTRNKSFLILVLFMVITLLMNGCTALCPSPTPSIYTITATYGTGGSIDPEGEISLVEGTNQLFTIIPDEGFEIDNVLINGTSVGAVSAYTFTDIQQNHTIEASFVQIAQPITPVTTPSPTPKYTITATSGKGGSIDPAGAIKVDKGNSQVFAIAPDESFLIYDVLVDGESVGAVGEYTFENILQDHVIEASFIRAEPLSVNWNFEDEEKRNSVIAIGNISVYTPDEGDGIIELIGASLYDFTLGSGGTGTNAATATLWPTGSAGNKYWLITISTTGYQNIEISSKQRSSPVGPRDFEVQYSTNKTTWLDITDTAITVANNFTGGVIDEVSLPTACDNQETLYLRWVMTSEININGGEVGPTGTNRIDDILVTGDIMEDF